MLKNIRFIIGLCLIGGVSLTGVVAWSTGAVQKAIATVSHLWDSLLAWLQQPLDLAHLMAGAGAIVIPLVIIFAVFMVLSDS